MKTPEVKRPPKDVLDKIHALKDKKGMIAVIELDDYNYLIGETLTEVLPKALKTYPNKKLYSIRVGYNYTYRFIGGTISHENTYKRED